VIWRAEAVPAERLWLSGDVCSSADAGCTKTGCRSLGDALPDDAGEAVRGDLSTLPGSPDPESQAACGLGELVLPESVCLLQEASRCGELLLAIVLPVCGSRSSGARSLSAMRCCSAASSRLISAPSRCSRVSLTSAAAASAASAAALTSAAFPAAAWTASSC